MDSIAIDMPVSRQRWGGYCSSYRRSTTQSVAQYDSIAGLALNDNEIGRPFYSGQLDFQKRDSVGLETAQPLIDSPRADLLESRWHRLWE